ncbi:MAG: right-handed parallel beta-helix repeat-containing protein, partial [Verrucomicrobiae bacterium]|nr:right-handed parallel beta-helix repeat-containing protein [Verrucomicrobiae bacterium]
MKKIKFTLSLIFTAIPTLLWTGCSQPNGGNQQKSAAQNAFYVDSWTGNDSHDELSPKTAWKTIARASRENYGPGQSLLLCEGRTFPGKLDLKVSGSAGDPFVVSSYPSDIGSDAMPVIDGAGYRACVEVQDGSHFVISNLELTADAGVPVETIARTERYGVLVQANTKGIHAGVTLKNLNIHDIFATESVDNDGQNPTSNKGYGIWISMQNVDAKIRDVVIEDCTLRKTGHTGIRIFGAYSEEPGNVYLENIQILNNYLKQIGGPGMVPGRCQNLLVRGNITDDTGSDVDPRMHNRGSGIWPWTSKDVLIEHNRFMHAFGKHDSHGAHIDFNCENVVVQYNLSIDNHGGFVEILGNNKNCSYRYNISVNDGWRNEGELGALSEGNTLWFSGYTGHNSPRIGPHNSYVYNNTVYVKADQR